MKYKYHIFIASFFLSVILWLSLNLNLSYEVEKKVPITFNVSKPFAVYGDIPPHLTVKLKGSGWDLLKLTTALDVDFTYNITAKINEKTTIISKDFISSKLPGDRNLSIISVSPETLYVYTDEYIEKYIKLLPLTQIECKNGYQVVETPMLEPDSILAGGSKHLLSGLKQMTTMKFTASNINSNINQLIRISDSLTGLLKLSRDEIRLTVKIEPSGDKEFQNVELLVSNVPSDKSVLLIPQNVKLHLKGGVNQLASMDNSIINGFVDFEEIFTDTTGSVSPHFKFPDGITVLSMQPEKIQYVIKKKF